MGAVTAAFFAVMVFRVFFDIAYVSGGSMEPVFYEGDMTEHELTEVFYRLAKQEVYPLENNPKIREAMKIAWIQSVVFKHPSFSSEREFSLVLSPIGKEYFGIKP